MNKTCGWNENGPYRIMHVVSAWSHVGGSLWGGLGSVALLEEVSLEAGLESLQPCLLAVCALSFMLGVQDVNSQLAAPAAMLPHHQGL